MVLDYYYYLYVAVETKRLGKCVYEGVFCRQSEVHLDENQRQYCFLPAG